MNADNIKKALSNYENEQVIVYIRYLSFLANEKKNGKYKNTWMNHRDDDYLSSCFKQVSNDGLIFDGKHITLQSTGVSYDYVAYKNKMLSIYPESLFDVQVVKEGDKFQFSKDSGHISYKHEITNPFGDADIIGAYCIIKNDRGEFLTVLSRAEIDKHRKVAKTDFIWNNWFSEMVMKTIIKKACKTHFLDVYQNMETLDNEQYDLDQPLGIPIETKQAIESIKSLEELTDYYNNNKANNAGVLEDFTLACTNRKNTLKTESDKQAKTDENS